MGDPPELFPALHGLWAVHFLRAELRSAYEIAEQLLRRAQSANDPALLMFAHFARGETLAFMGELLPAGQQVETAIGFYDRERDRLLAFRYGGIDARVWCLSSAVRTLWQIGYPDQALRRGNEALALARELSHPRSLAFAEYFVGMLRRSRREVRAAQEIAENAIAICAERGFTDLLAYAIIQRAWTVAEQGGHDEGITQIQEGVAALRTTGAELIRPYFLCLLAEACGKADRLEDGLSALTEALAAADEHENRNYEAEIHRLKGELLLRRHAKRSEAEQTSPRGGSGIENSNVGEAQSCFERAIEVARNQSAKSFELRATVSLARLIAKQGRREEARATLAEIYGWFTEGFDTADLKDAKTLLGELKE